MAQPASEPEVSPSNRGPIEKNSQQARTAKELIEKEWKIIDSIQKLAEDPHYGTQRAFYYQTLASHVRTLSMLLKLHGQQDQSQDIAKLLSQIDTDAAKLAKRLRQRCRL